MFKKLVCILLVVFMMTGLVACKGEKLPEYSQKEFGIAGYWAPYEISEESFKLYQDAGLNTMLMINHSGERTSDEQFYLGSNRTLKALELCKKLGMKAVLNYNDWIAASVEGEGYYSETPFTQHDVYGEYKDIISGIHIVDEPKYEQHFPIYANETLINDFKKAYPNADYVFNLIPIYSASSYGFTTYENMLEVFGKEVMSHFEKPYISTDIYPFHTKVENVDFYLASNHELLAKEAKKYGAEKTFIVQSATGEEFEETLSEGDMRWQVYVALAFGADNLQYYCYTVPKGREYNYCMLNADNTPSDVYYHVQKINKEIQSYASVILSYDWDASLGIGGTEETTFRLGSLEYDETYTNKREFTNSKHYASVTAKRDLLVSRFEAEEYGEGYMFVNYAERDQTNTVEVTFKDCKKVAIYGGIGFDGTAKVVELDENGKLNFELAYGEGVFVTPLV